MATYPLPLPLFDTLEHLQDKNAFSHINNAIFPKREINCIYSFLKQYEGSAETFKTYRREIERLMQWSAWIRKKSILNLDREEIEVYLKFCKRPPRSWIGTSKVSRFLSKQGKRIPNPKWRPFVATVNKVDSAKGESPDRSAYQLSDKAFEGIFAVLSTFYSHLVREEHIKSNPIMKIRQKSQYMARQAGKKQIRRITELQWHYVIETAEIMAKEDPDMHERTLFIMTALYSLYLRISELVGIHGWTPKMNDFWENEETHQWWFHVKGKRNIEREIAVRQSMLKALIRWRKFLKISSSLPSPDESTPLIPKVKGKGGVSSTNQIRNIVQKCFDRAIDRMQEEGYTKEIDRLKAATVHWLRHTGISDDVKFRPREHVRDDAGHSSSATTDKYINVEMEERHKSANKKSTKKLTTGEEI